jgi:hypothetical protein
VQSLIEVGSRLGLAGIERGEGALQEVALGQVLAAP